MADILLNPDGSSGWPFASTQGETADDPDSLVARPYGAVRADLDIDFAFSKRPALVTQLLTGCLRKANGEHIQDREIWGWTLTRRLQGLLSISVTTRSQTKRVPARCPRESCHEFMELELDLLSFEQPEDTGTFTCTPERDVNVTIRLPTGNDQMNWLNENSQDMSGWAAFMATSVVTSVNGAVPEADWQVPNHWLPALEAVLEKHDPFTAMQLDAHCPSCNEAVQVELDLEDLLLQMLASDQRHLLDQIHRLASAYHWSEDEILSLPPRRREYYLRRINEEQPV